MAPARKQKHIKVPHQPSHSPGYVHPSLRANDENRNSNLRPVSSESVNQRIDHLRRAQASRTQIPNLFPLLQSRHATSFLQPRRNAGPPPPRSWVVQPGSGRGGGSSETQQRRLHNAIDSFPGIEDTLPPQSSLLHLGLKSLAQNLDWHLEWDHYWLSALQDRHKNLLCSYIAQYSENPISIPVLRRLFATTTEIDLLPDLDFEADNELVHRLDLSFAINQSLDLKALGRFLTVQPPKVPSVQLASLTIGERDDHSTTKDEPGTSPPDSWEDTSPTIPRPLQPTDRFPNLTHLSLAYPKPTASWTDLISLSRQLRRLTHLSLAGWPVPSLSQTSTTLQQRPSEPISKSTDLLEEGVVQLRALSRNLTALEYLDISDCQEWFHMLTYKPPIPSTGPLGRPSRLHTANRVDTGFDDDNNDHGQRSHGGVASRPIVRGVDWSSSWSRISCIKIHTSTPLPRDVHPLFLSKLLRARGRASTNLTNPQNNDIQQQSEEEYRISSDNPSVRARMTEQIQRKKWMWSQKENVLLEGYIRSSRLESSRNDNTRAIGMLKFDYGWDRSSLDGLYDEARLFEAGL